MKKLAVRLQRPRIWPISSIPRAPPVLLRVSKSDLRCPEPGVRVPQEAVANLLQAFEDLRQEQCFEDVLVSVTTCCFDISVLEPLELNSSLKALS